MLCTNCQKENREGSRFCQFCGSPIVAPVETPVAEPVAEEVALETVAPVEEVVVEEKPVIQEESAPEEVVIPQEIPELVVAAPEELPEEPKKEKKAKKEKKVKEKKAKAKKPVFLIIVTVLMTLLFLASAGLNVYQYYQQKDLVKENETAVAGLNGEISKITKEKEETQLALKDANDANKQLKADLDELSAAMNKQAPVIDAYSRLINSFMAGVWGGYSEEFFAEHYAVCVAPGEEFKLKLHTEWKGEGTVTVKADSDFATAKFSENTWETETDVLITGVKEGVSVVTFTWDNEKSFDVIVIGKK